MPRVAKLEPKEDKGKGKWVLNIPASLSDTGERRRVYFSTEPLAQAQADKLQRERKQWGVRAKHAEPHLVTEAVAADKLLQPYGVGLLEVVRQWIARRDRLDASESVEDAWQHFERLKSSEGRSAPYLRSIRQLRASLPESFLSRQVAELEPGDVEAVLESTTNGAAMWNLRRRELSAVFSESVRRGKADANPASKVLVKKKAKAARIDILTVAEAKRLLAACKGTIPMPKGRGKEGKLLGLSDAVPAVAVALFAGLRP
jgi:hypothetical protein